MLYGTVHYLVLSLKSLEQDAELVAENGETLGGKASEPMSRMLLQLIALSHAHGI